MTGRLSSAPTQSERRSGWAYFLFHLLVLGNLLTALNGYLPKPISDTQLNFLFYLFNFICTALIFRRFLWDSLKRALRHPAIFCQAVILGLAAYYACTNSLTQIITHFDPGFANLNDAAIASLREESWKLMAIGTVLLVPAAEECFYRGLIFRPLYDRSPAAAYCLSMAAFSAVHVVGYLGHTTPLRLLLCFVQYLPAGLCLAWSYAKSGTILAPIVIHALINAQSIWALR